MVLSLDSTVRLKKHSGRTLDQIICGFSSGDEKKLLNAFLKDYIDFFSHETDFDILIPSFFKNSFYSKQIVENLENRNSYIKFDAISDYMKSVDFVDDNTILINPYSDDIHKTKVSYFLKTSLSTEFQYDRPFFGTYKNKRTPIFSNRTLSCFAEPEYISWCISNLNNFAIDEIAIEKEYEISSLNKLEIIPINDDKNHTYIGIHTKQGYCIWYDKTCSVVCKPILKKQTFKFKEEIKRKNYWNLERIRINSLKGYNKNNSNWLSDASGSNDPETMNDVYWNLN